MRHKLSHTNDTLCHIQKSNPHNTTKQQYSTEKFFEQNSIKHKENVSSNTKLLFNVTPNKLI